MTYRIVPRVEQVAAPPIADAHRWPVEPQLEILDLAQAVPSYAPPASLTGWLGERLRDPETAIYTPILGLPALREALARRTASLYHANIDADTVAITAGCNQAFCAVMSVIAAEGDEVLLPLPYYFNHRMWLDMIGVRAVDLPFNPRGAVPEPAAAAERIGPRTRAIVLVTPNNPTGAVYPPAVLQGFYDLARRHGIALVVDETYRDFLDPGTPPHGLFANPDWQQVLVHLYSFSKVYALTGYRVGAVIGGPELRDALGKLLDCVAICAPHIGQEAALYGLERLDRWVAARRAEVDARGAALADALRRSNSGFELVSVGAFFAWVRHPFEGVPSLEVARRLASECAIRALPGSMFGPGQDDYLRFACANLEADRMPEVARRLETLSVA